MSRFDFVRPSGQWANEMVPGASDYQRLDVAQAKGVSGDLGGSYTPTKPIIIGGAGLTSTAAATLMSGGVSTATGGRVVIAASAGDAPTLSPTRTRTIRVPLIDTVFSPADLSNPGTFQWCFDDVKGWGVMSTGLGTPIMIEIHGRYMHIGAQLRSASLSYVVTAQPASVPSTPMYFVFCGSDETGTNTQFANPSLFSSVPGFALGNVGQWLATHAFTADQYIVPFTPPVGELGYFTCTTSGTTAGTEPTWPTTIGGTVTDGSVVWTLTGLVGASFGGGETPAAYYANGAPQELVATYDGVGTGTYSNVISEGIRYAFVIESSDNTVLLTGLSLTFAEIGDMRFE